MITKEQINNIPSTIGIYFFKQGETILYIGKSVNIRARVKSHLENAKLDRKEYQIVKNSNKIETLTVENEFKSLILEAELIKKYRPKYNIIWKDGKSHLYIKVTIKDNYPKVLISRKEDDKKSLYFGPFSSTRLVESLVDDIRHIVPFCTQKNLSKSSCFYSKINLCHPCPNSIEKLGNEEKLKLKRLYRKNIRKVIRILQGGVVEILNDLYRQLKNLTREKKYEDAIVIRNKIFRLERLINHPTSNFDFYQKNNNDFSILLTELKKYYPSLKKLERLECYDISNLGDKNQVGSMVVMTNGIVDKKEYRKFKIKNNLKSDFERLSEIITRRFNNDWQEPDLMIIDGGRPQVKIVTGVLNSLNKSIPVLGIAKNPDRLIIKSGVDYFTVRFPQTLPSFNVIRLIRDESHRFANKYHRQLRSSDFLV